MSVREQFLLPQKSRFENSSLQGPAQEPFDNEEVEEEDVEEDGDDDEEANVVTVVQLALVGDPPPDCRDEVAVVTDHCQQQCDRLHQPIVNAEDAFDENMKKITRMVTLLLIRMTPVIWA